MVSFPKMSSYSFSAVRGFSTDLKVMTSNLAGNLKIVSFQKFSNVFFFLVRYLNRWEYVNYNVL